MTNPELTPLINWAIQALLAGVGGLALRYLRQIRNDIRRQLWQNDVMWSVFCIERDIPLSSAKYAGSSKGKEVAIEIIATAKKKKMNGSASASPVH